MTQRQKPTPQVDDTWKRFVHTIVFSENFTDALNEVGQWGTGDYESVQKIFEWLKGTCWFERLIEESHEVAGLTAPICEAKTQSELDYAYRTVHLEIFRKIGTTAASYFVMGVAVGVFSHLDEINLRKTET